MTKERTISIKEIKKTSKNYAEMYQMALEDYEIQRSEILNNNTLPTERKGKLLDDIYTTYMNKLRATAQVRKEEMEEKKKLKEQKQETKINFIL